MLFNSLQFLVFFIIVTTLYFVLPHKYRWFLLLLSSCYFYMAFVPLYILILGFTIVVDYFAGMAIENAAGKRRKLFLIFSLIANIGVLAVFKYYNFINENHTFLLKGFALQNPIPYLSILLPIGLSFHTFQAMSYTIEVYRGNQKAERNFLIYSLYVMFYPQLVAGPIERPQNLLTQFHGMSKIQFDAEKCRSGLLLMAFGLFKKVVIADRLSLFVDGTYNNPSSQSSLALVIASFFYSFQIYCDFSGYSDMAIGAARVMGIDLMENFRSPYFSKSIPEFWRRWHISLSTWFRDYLFIPLGGSRTGRSRFFFNIMVVFLISGFWHGANWTFIIWGGIHGILMILFSLAGKSSKDKGHENKWKSLGSMIMTFLLVNFAWIFFRARNFGHAMDILSNIVRWHGGSGDWALNINELLFSFFLIFFLLWKEHYVPRLPSESKRSFALQLLGILGCCYLFGVFSLKQFIYFQF